MVKSVGRCSWCNNPLRGKNREFCSRACFTSFDRRWIPEPNSGCWLWLGSMTDKGYGCLEVNGHTKVASRHSWELVNGPMPDDMDTDHLCRNPSCVNPAHLESVTSQVNNLRRPYVITKRASPTCINGHPWAANTYTNPTTGYRHCRSCMEIGWKKYRAKRRAARQESAYAQ